MSDLEARLAALEATVGRLSDRLAILDLLARYGPAADCADGEAYEQLFASDGALDSRGNGAWQGRAALRSVMIDNPLHCSLVEQGCAHIGALPRIELHGDTAIAYQYLRLYTPADRATIFGGRAMEITRLTFVRNDLYRHEGRWRIARRTSIPVQGPLAHEAQVLMREAAQDGD